MALSLLVRACRASARGAAAAEVWRARFNNDTVTVVLDSSYRLGDMMRLDVYTTSSGVRVVYTNEVTGATKDTGLKFVERNQWCLLLQG